ncbi:MAG TPA: hypothetical protein VFU76_09715 [Terriglobales bacterium]|nr:hypothetical protein [Terriglobales bacterium]
MRKLIRFTCTSLIVVLLALTASSSGSAKKEKKKKEDVVYVCACLRDRSCSCMTMAKTEGPCACGTKGGPPLQAVPKDSNWAKANRDALAR